MLWSNSELSRSELSGAVQSQTSLCITYWTEMVFFGAVILELWSQLELVTVT